MNKLEILRALKASKLNKPKYTASDIFPFPYFPRNVLSDSKYSNKITLALKEVRGLKKKKRCQRTSLVIQWMRVCLPRQGKQVGKIPQAVCN